MCALPGLALAGAEDRSAQLKAILERPDTDVSVSVGFAELRPEELLDDTVARADHEMYDRRRAQRSAAGDATSSGPSGPS